MKKISDSNRFKRDFRLAEKRGWKLEKLAQVINLLAADQPLPPHCRPHKLVGEYIGQWECHIEPDWLLIYDVDEESLFLIRTGSHADLFR
jgi:mRNA interferase YafQ